jgi:cytochrome c peroxidase
MKKVSSLFSAAIVLFLTAVVSTSPQQSPQQSLVGADLDRDPAQESGRRLFEKETFGGNGRTCRTCHTEETGTLSPEDVKRRFRQDRHDPLFVHDGSDDGLGHGTKRIRNDATILVTVPLAPNVKLAADPDATSVVVPRGIPTTLNSPALDPVLMLDGRQPDLQSQAMGAIHDHAQATSFPTGADLERIKNFELSNAFFSDPSVRRFARGGKMLDLPKGHTASEKRGRRFFEDVVDVVDLKHGACAGCHAGPMLNETNLFGQLAFGVPKGTRFQSIGVSELNAAGNPVHEYIFNEGMPNERRVSSPDPGRSLITGVTDVEDKTFSNFNAFKIPQLRGIRNTAPYFHDNSAKTLEDVMVHYQKFFEIATQGALVLTPDDQKDIVAFMKLLD